MCRFVAYIGKSDLLVSKLIEEPENSLMKQSRSAKEGLHGINADGFGLAWYNHKIDNDPGVFKFTQPAWNDTNLKYIARHLQSNCFLAHIRASTVGGVSLNNCHPFSYKQYAFVHNGTIRYFEKIKRAIINELDDSLFFEIKGQTDSEYLFFLIMQFLHNSEANTLESAVRKAFEWITEKQSQDDDEHFSRLNIIITDGHELIATRYVTKGLKPVSLSYLVNHSHSIIVASEPLDNDASAWVAVPSNHFLVTELGNIDPRIKKI